ncbi:hypothetical protein N7510_010009 [Penicillium lagena]|uniref:uncharacterized protein n=1 Tax=Penicillium lagena TaxID=94218 RepID=UPI002540CD6C|nr:uncharacterized protein N7510_010009 [Penicillium lagena]KAJ5604855.1 hypothetical protein N7510_010009 [Penicillium lagena]
MDKTTPEQIETVSAEHLEGAPREKWLSVTDAHNAFTAERSAGIWESMMQHKRAVLWSLVISTSIIMEGYDTALMPSFFGYPSFIRRYGQYFPSIKEYQLTGAWQAGLVNSSNAGVIIGGFINGWACDRYGYKRTILVSMVAIAAFLFVTFFSPNAQVLAVGQVLCGLPWGVFATIGPAYASEVCPLALRGYLTVYINVCWATGQLLANGVLRGLVNNTTQWSYRIPWAIQWVWPPFLFFAYIFAPESPWWHLRKGRLGEAEKSLRRLSDRSDDEIRSTLAQMTHTIELEREIQSGSSYWDCFKGVDLRRTEICCCAFATQMLAGAQFAYGPSYFFEQAGMTPENAYMVGIGGTALEFVGTVFSWGLLTFFGRRTIFLTGISSLTVILFSIGIISAITNNTPAMWAQASLCLIWQLAYSLTIGPLAYAIISETSAVRLRAQTVVLARNTYNLTAIWCAVLEPYMMNPTAWDMKGKTAFVWGSTAAVMTVWVFFRLPECKGRTYEELDLLFAKKVSARKFKTAVVEPYADETDVVQL